MLPSIASTGIALNWTGSLVPYKVPRMYDHRGYEVGAVIGGAVLGALLEGVTADGEHKHIASNFSSHSGYNGCHGIRCMVDDPDQSVDNTPQFDREGEPNFDEHGNYQGRHGAGCLGDAPGDTE